MILQITDQPLPSMLGILVVSSDICTTLQAKLLVMFLFQADRLVCFVSQTCVHGWPRPNRKQLQAMFPGIYLAPSGKLSKSYFGNRDPQRLQSSPLGIFEIA
jgi:hypothetical protein